MDEVLDGVLHWTTFHEGIGQPVHSHFYVEGGALFDPRVPEIGGIDEVARHGRPEVVLLSNHYHVRHSATFAERFDCAIKVHRAGLDGLSGPQAPDVMPFDFGDEVAPGVTALEVGVLIAEDTAFHLAAGPGVLLFADALIRDDEGELAFVPDALMGDDPAGVRRALTARLEALLERDDFDALLFAHGAPVAAGGYARLEAFVGRQGQAAA